MKTTLEIIVAELERQFWQTGASHVLYWLGTNNPERAVLDGCVDLVALARAVDARGEDPDAKPIKHVIDTGSLSGSVVARAIDEGRK